MIGRPDPASRGILQAEATLQEARTLERAGDLAGAARGYEATIVEAEHAEAPRVLAEALRRLAVVRFQRGDPEAARELGRRSHRVATGLGNDLLAAEALNTLATVDLQTGKLEAAQETYERGLALGGHDRAYCARVQQNLGVLANIRGDLDAARSHYEHALAACTENGDRHGQAIAYHNLGMVSADAEAWDSADAHFERSLGIATASGDVHLKGLCLVNHAEVHLARQRYELAQRDAEAALAIFDQLGARSAKADAYRVIGMVYRDTNRHALAESRLRDALELAAAVGTVLGEAEATRELALLYQALGRNQEALSLLNRAHGLFQRLDARVDLINVRRKVAILEKTYLAVVREWGQSIESSDSYTHGHCERVATYAVAVAARLGLDQREQRTVRIGAYLHDVGKVRVPHEILNKPGPLTRDEFEVMQQHTVWGVELLESVEFPWDIKPIIRWHHEKHDGTGYPDRLKGDEIPLAAQIIGIADVFDALTTTRAYRPAMDHDAAVAEIEACARWWRPDVLQAFRDTVAVRAADPGRLEKVA